MSDTTVAVETAPTAVPTPAAPEPTASKPETASPFQRATQGARQRAEQVFAPKEPAPADTRPRNADGTFATKPESAATPSAEPAQPPAPTVPETVRIQLSEDHPLRHRLGAEIEVPKHLEEFARFNLNQPIKQKTVDEAIREKRQLEAERDAWKEHVFAVFQDPDISIKYAHIKEQWGEEDAKLFLRGKIAELADGVTQKRGEIEQQDAQASALEMVNSFVAATQDKVIRSYIPGAPMHEMQSAYQEAWAQYTTHAQREEALGRPFSLDESTFLVSFVEPELMRRDGRGAFRYPGVQFAINQFRTQRQTQNAQDAEARVRAEKEEAERKTLEDARLRHQNRAPHAPSNVQTGVNTQTETPPAKGGTADQMKRGAISRARERAEAVVQSFRR